jgi:hypothetical protein
MHDVYVFVIQGWALWTSGWLVWDCISRVCVHACVHACLCSVFACCFMQVNTCTKSTYTFFKQSVNFQATICFMRIKYLMCITRRKQTLICLYVLNPHAHTCMHTYIHSHIHTNHWISCNTLTLPHTYPSYIHTYIHSFIHTYKSLNLVQRFDPPSCLPPRLYWLMFYCWYTYMHAYNAYICTYTHYSLLTFFFFDAPVWIPDRHVRGVCVSICIIYVRMFVCVYIYIYIYMSWVVRVSICIIYVRKLCVCVCVWVE